MLAVLADGEPASSFSPLLLHTYDAEGNITGQTEPLAANIDGPGHTIDRRKLSREMVRIYAALLGVPFDTLWQRERRARTNRLIALMGAALAVMAVFFCVVLTKNREITARNLQITEQNEQILQQNEFITGQNVQITEQNRQITEANDRITEQYGQIARQNDQITEQNDQITRQNEQLQRQLSSMQVDAGLTKLKGYDVQGALQSGLDAMEAGEALYDHRSEKLLGDALLLYRDGQYRSRELFRESTDIVSLAVTPDGLRALLMDRTGFVRCVDTETGAVLWEAASWEEGQSTGDENSELLLAGDAVLCRNALNVAALSVGDGTLLWNYTFSVYGGIPLRALSADGSLLCLLDETEEDRISAIVLDTASGRVLQRLPLGIDGSTVFKYNIDYWYNGCISFSEDGGYLAVCVPEVPAGSEEDVSQFTTYLFSVGDWTLQRYNIWPANSRYVNSVFWGMHVENGTGDIVIAQYYGRYGGVILSDIRWDAEDPVRRTQFDSTISAVTGVYTGVFDGRLEVRPMLVSDHLVLVFCEEFLYMLDRETGSLNKSFKFSGRIRTAFWLDRDEELLAMITEDGTESVYDLEHEDGNAISAYRVTYIDQSGILLAAPVRGGLYADPAHGMYLTVRQDDRGQLLVLRTESDAAGETVPDLAESFNREYCLFAPGQSPDRILAVTRNTEELVITAFDALTHETPARTALKMSRAERFGILDDTHVLYGIRVCGMDGSVEYLEGITENSRFRFLEYYLDHVRLYTGQMLTAANKLIYSSHEADLAMLWLDGDLVEAHSMDGFTPADLADTVFRAGANGLTVQNGTADGGEPAFDVSDVLRDTHAVFLDRHPEATEKMLAVGTREPVFAAADELGHICIYDSLQGTAADFPADYAVGEIQTVGFAGEDRYLLVLTQTGRLDCWDRQTGQRMYAETVPLLGEYVPFIGRITATADEAHSRLHVLLTQQNSTNSWWVCLDTEAWIELAAAKDVYAVLPEQGVLYTLRGSRVVRYPLRTPETIRTEASPGDAAGGNTRT